MPKRKLTDFDLWQLHRLRAYLEAESSKQSVDWTFVAELDACKSYLTEIGLGHLVPIFEEREQLRLRGAVLRTPGTKDMPQGCLACFAATGMETNKPASKKPAKKNGRR